MLGLNGIKCSKHRPDEETSKLRIKNFTFKKKISIFHNMLFTGVVDKQLAVNKYKNSSVEHKHK